VGPGVRAVERKVPGGKLLRLRLDDDGVRLTGDFFLHPEDAIADLEALLTRLSGDADAMAAAIEQWMAEEGVVAVGFAPSDLAVMLAEARR